MSNLMLEVICENNKIDFFKEGIVGHYYYIGHPTEYEKEPAYVVKVFFNNAGEFKGILLCDDYKEELKNEFESLINCCVQDTLEDYELVSFVKVEDNEIKFERCNLRQCNKCKKIYIWEDCTIWECDKCFKPICSDCINEYDEESRSIGISNLDTILCNTCFNKREISYKKARIEEITEELNSSERDKFYSSEDIMAFKIEKEILENELARLTN